MTTPIRSVLALEHNDPICADCAKALGGRPIDKMATVSPQECAHCHAERSCVAVRDYVWPAAMRRPLHAQPDDYSELESLLGKRDVDQ